MENFRNRRKVDFFNRGDDEKNIKQPAKITFNGIHEPFRNHDSYTFKQNEVLMEKPIYVGYFILEMSKRLLYKIYWDKLQANFGKKKIKIHHVDTDAIELSITSKIFIKDLKNLRLKGTSWFLQFQ